LQSRLRFTQTFQDEFSRRVHHIILALSHEAFQFDIQVVNEGAGMISRLVRPLRRYTNVRMVGVMMAAHFVGTARDELAAFPESARRRFGHELFIHC
jgi:hypothetical protein